MAKKNDTRVVYRDSDNGRIISREQAERKNPATWEKQHVHYPKKPNR